MWITSLFQDTYSEENGAPVVDTMSQDWKLLEASEDAEYTRVTVRRFLRLCDPKDRNITVRPNRDLRSAL